MSSIFRVFGRANAGGSTPDPDATQAANGTSQNEEPGWRFSPSPYRLRTTLASLTSVTFHLVLLIVCAQITLSGYPQRMLDEITALMEEEPPQETPELPDDLKMAEPGDEPKGSVVAAESYSVASIAADEPRVDAPVVASDNLAPDLPLVHDETVGGIEASDIILQRGGAGEEVSTVEGAVDRLTHEIVSNLEHGKLLVAWLMDASISLADDREAIADRLQRVFGELGDLGQLHEEMLLNAVVSFGLNANYLLPPSAETDKVIGAIRGVPTDESGVENVFSAVIGTIGRYRASAAKQDRRIMLIIWTDESGDDYGRLEEAIKVCRRLSVPVFTVGPSSMFGREKGFHSYKNPEDGKTYPIEVDRGPDTARYELLRMPYWFEGPQFERLHAGLGPYALTRMAVETGGAYFISEDKTDKSPYPLDTMRRYLPEYTSAADYQRQVAHSKLRQAILHAVDATLAREMKGTPRLEFEPTGDNFQDQLRDAQQSVAFNGIIINEALRGFGPKGLEDEYAKETSPRWRAWYDLTYGRLLAMQVRTTEYNFTCAEMKGKGADFVDKQSNRWKFKPADKIRFGQGAERQAAEARRLLQRCIEQNPNTPWQALAQRELKDPFGFHIEEGFVPRPEERMTGGPNVMPRGRRVEQLRNLPRPDKPNLPNL